jgi:hypothetical protein
MYIGLFGLKKGVLSQFHLSRVLFYAIWEVKANKKKLKLNGRYSFWSIVMMLTYSEETNIIFQRK